MTENQSPFTGSVTTVEQVHEALASQGFQEDCFTTIVEIPPPFQKDGITHGPLDKVLTDCKPNHLATGWPAVFRVSVRTMLEQAGYVARG